MLSVHRCMNYFGEIPERATANLVSFTFLFVQRLGRSRSIDKVEVGMFCECTPHSHTIPTASRSVIRMGTDEDAEEFEVL